MEKPGKKKRSLAHRLWGLLPSVFVLVLIGVIVLLLGQIKSESKVIKDRKISELRTERPKTNVIAMEMVPSMLRERIDLPGFIIHAHDAE